MTELKQDHFEVIDSNKHKAYEEQKQMRDEIAFFALHTLYAYYYLLLQNELVLIRSCNIKPRLL